MIRDRGSVPRRPARIFGDAGQFFSVLTLVVSVLIGGLVAPTIAAADPGCPEFRNPATGVCEPYVVPSDTEYSGEDAFLAESGTLFALSTGEEVLELGYSICRALARGTPLGEIAQEMINGGIDETSAVEVLANAHKLLC